MSTSATTYDYTVFIGRFEPLHRAHLDTIQFALSMSSHLFLVLGSHRAAPSFSCPWSAVEREEMIRSVLTPAENARVTFLYVRDRLFDLKSWTDNVYQEVYQHVADTKASIALVGHFKDSSSSYLSLFARWHFVNAPVTPHLNATDFRRWFFLNQGDDKSKDIPPSILKWLAEYKKTARFSEIAHEAALLPSKEHYNKFIYEYALFYCHRYVLLERRWGRELFSLVAETTQEYPAVSTTLPQGGGEFSAPLLHDLSFWQSRLGVHLTLSALQQCSWKVRSFYDAISQKRSQIIEIYADALDICPKIQNPHTHRWVLVDDLPLLQDKIYGDHFPILQTSGCVHKKEITI